jgi:catechol 2,3-dioxygenase-like lactoylglutathione lyase family enzyme
VTPLGGVPGVEGLDHVGLNVPDMDQAVRFFTEAFGATTLFCIDRIADPEGGAMERLGAPRAASFELTMLQLGSGRLELLRWWTEDPSDDAPRSSGLGAAHVAIKVSDVAAAVACLGAMDGVQVLGQPITFASGVTPGLTNAFVTTPWGALVELLDWGQPTTVTTG